MAMDDKNRVVGNNADPEMKTKNKRKKATGKKAHGTEEMDIAAPVFLKSKFFIRIFLLQQVCLCLKLVRL